MKGCVFKRRLPSGSISWGYSIDVGGDEKGKRRQLFKSGFARRGEAEDALRKILNEKDAGELVKPDPTTFAGFLDEWFREHAKRQCTPKTIERYRQLANYLLPHIGSTKLQQLSALGLERLFNHLKDAGGKERKTKKPRPLSARTVRHIAGLMHVALRTAVRWKLLKVNPIDAVMLPKVKKQQARALDPGQLAWYAEAARSHGLYEFLMTAAATGCRRGELLALQWTDIDLTGRSLWITKSVEQTKAGLRVKPTKSEKPRPVSLPGSTVEILKSLKEAQTKQKALFGTDYRTDLNLVFCSLYGDYLKPDSVTAKACLIARRVGLESTGIHTLRHSHGTSCCRPACHYRLYQNVWDIPAYTSPLQSTATLSRRTKSQRRTHGRLQFTK
jgi:integrase